MRNLDSLPTRDYSRIPVIESLQAVHDFDLCDICESSRNESISNDNLNIHGFSPEPLRADKSLTSHNGGVCLYFKENIPLKRREDLELIDEILVVEIRQKNNKKPLGIVLTGDFNARSSYSSGDDADTREDQILSEMSIFNNLEQLICEPTHIRDDGSQFCIDLIFTDVQIIPRSEKQSKHLIVHGKINFSVPSPPPYKRKIWDYSHANYANISAVLNNIDWVNIYFKKNVDEMTTFFSESL